MPSSATITSTQIISFNALRSGQTISSLEVDSAFSTWRGFILPVSPTTSTAIDMTYDLGSTEYSWRTGYISALGDTKDTTGGFTVSKTDRFIHWSGSSNTTINLPTAVSITGHEFYFKKTGNNAAVLTIDASGAQTIDGTTVVTIATYNESKGLVAKGGNWETFGGGGSGGGALAVTASRASPSTITAAGGIAFTGTQARQLWFIIGDTTTGTDVTANPQIAAGSTVGQELILRGRSDSAYVLLEDGNGLSLKGDMYVEAESEIGFLWDGTNWAERYRSG